MINYLIVFVCLFIIIDRSSELDRGRDAANAIRVPRKNVTRKNWEVGVIPLELDTIASLGDVSYLMHIVYIIVATRLFEVPYLERLMLKPCVVHADKHAERFS